MVDKLHLRWREQYRRERYMEHLKIEELRQRAGDVMTNLEELTPEGKIGAVAFDGEGRVWGEKWTHVLEEFQLRFGPYPAGWSEDVLAHVQHPKVRYARLPSEYLALASRRDVLLKFGKRAHMESLFEQGQIRIAPASGYQDPSLNPAVHDDELSFESIAPPGFTVAVSTKPEGLFVPVGGMRELRMKSTSPTDYFVYCMSFSAQPRLFGDFEADACVVFTNPNEFVARVATAVQPVLPGYAHAHGKVSYADPHFYHGRPVIAMTKHFRFAYQREFRLIWVPPATRMELTPFCITVGGLKEIARLITLPGRVGQPDLS